MNPIMQLAVAQRAAAQRAAQTLSPERIAQLDAVKAALNGFMNPPTADKLGYLWSRWQDEKEYEDFKEYEAQMKLMVTEQLPAFTFIKGTKRPFGIQCKHPYTPKLIFAITVTGNSIKWKGVSA